MKKILFILLFSVNFAFPAPQVFITTGTHESATKTGALRYCITQANLYPGSTIAFNIPLTDIRKQRGGNWAYFRISPASALPDITAWTCIDGSTERFYLGIDTNPYGPEIEIRGPAGSATYGLSISSKCNIIELAINGFSSGDGIDLNANSAYTNIKGCYIGISATGTVAIPNGYDGIWLTNNDSCNNITIGGTAIADRNVISGNDDNGINEFYAGGLTNPFICDIVGNYVGTDYTGLCAIPNGNAGIDSGIAFSADSSGGHIVRNNLISGNYNAGIYLAGSETNVLVKNNIIGVGDDGITKLGHINDGVAVFQTVSGSTITSNVIANNNYGIHLDNADTPNPVRIFMSSNSIYNNTTLGINNETGTNERITPPLIRGATTYSTTAFIEGTSSATARIEVFIASATQTAGQGKIYVGSTTASIGIWTLSVPSEYVGYMIANSSVTATQFVSRSGTSQFATNVRIRQGAVPVSEERRKYSPRIIIY